MTEHQPEKPLPEAAALPLSRKPGEPHPDAEAPQSRKPMDAEGYAEYKRLERERALRLAVADTPELSAEDSAYVARLRTKSARAELVCSNLEKAEILALCEMQFSTVSAYLLSVHRHTVNNFKATTDPRTLAAFNVIMEQHYARLTGERVQSQMDAEMLQGSRRESNAGE